MINERIKYMIDHADKDGHDATYILGYVHALEEMHHEEEAKEIREYATIKKISTVFSMR